MTKRRFATRIVHAGETRVGGVAVPPIYQSTVFEQTEPDPSYDQIRYPRLNNTPNHEIVGAKIADLEGAEDGFVAASGMAAITTTLLHVLRDGGHLIAQDCLYGGTHNFVRHQLEQFGCSASTFDARNPNTWPELVGPNTRAIYVEAMTNPLLTVVDHRAVVEFAQSHGLVSIIDSTFASPVNFRAAEFGYDFVLHSATKYLNGHSDLCAGAVVGRRDAIAKLRSFFNLLGGTLDPLLCFLLHRGMRTLEMRVQRQNATAAALAAHLESHAAVTRVHHPSLPSHPDHALAAELFDGFGGVLSFELGSGAEGALRLIDSLELPIHAPSLGGGETLITRPCKTSHASLTAAERTAIGIHDGLCRVAVGWEHPDDLIQDFGRALTKA